MTSAPAAGARPPILTRMLPRQLPGLRLEKIAPPLILLAGILTPTGLQAQVGGLLLFPYRVALIVLLPFLLLQMVRRGTRFNAVDWLILFLGGWTIVSMMANSGILPGIEDGGRTALDILVSYFIGRVYFAHPDQWRRFLSVSFLPICVVGAILLIESVTHRFIVTALFPLHFVPDQQLRMGLMRGLSVFPHQILAGMFFASLFPLYYFAFRGTKGNGHRATVGLFALFAVSSAAILSLLVALALAIYVFVSRLTLKRLDWRPIVILGILALLALQFGADGGAMRWIVRNLTLDPQTGYFRILIWDFGSASALAHPWLGIGNESYERPVWMLTDSIDNYWLFLAMRFGMPAALAATAAVFCTIALANRARRALLPFDPARADVFVGLIISLFCFWLLVWTVALWDNVLSWFYLLLGVTVGMSATVISEVAAVQSRARRTAAPPPATLPSNKAR